MTTAINFRPTEDMESVMMCPWRAFSVFIPRFCQTDVVLFQHNHQSISRVSVIPRAVAFPVDELPAKPLLARHFPRHLWRGIVMCLADIDEIE